MSSYRRGIHDPRMTHMNDRHVKVSIQMREGYVTRHRAAVCVAPYCYDETNRYMIQQQLAGTENIVRPVLLIVSRATNYSQQQPRHIGTSSYATLSVFAWCSQNVVSPPLASSVLEMQWNTDFCKSSVAHARNSLRSHF